MSPYIFSSSETACVVDAGTNFLFKTSQVFHTGPKSTPAGAASSWEDKSSAVNSGIEKEPLAMTPIEKPPAKNKAETSADIKIVLPEPTRICALSQIPERRATPLEVGRALEKT